MWIVFGLFKTGIHKKPTLKFTSEIKMEGQPMNYCLRFKMSTNSQERLQSTFEMYETASEQFF
uniref:Uncharacterized protein n=1 Tax=Anguilla anguilla TaxID=7936 RepID=A0A0E9Y2I1_ANGAN